MSSEAVAATNAGQAVALPGMPLPSAAAEAPRARTPFASSEDEQMAEFIETVLALHAEGKAAAASSGDLLGDTGFARGVAGADKWDRVMSIAAGLKREEVMRAYEHADEHLTDTNPTTPGPADESGRAVPGGPRLHPDASGALVDTGDRFLGCEELTAAAIGPVLRVSKGRAMGEVTSAIEIAQLAPNLHERSLCGDYSEVHTRVFLDAFRHLSAAVLHDADTVIAAKPGRVGLRELRQRITNYLARRNLPRTAEAKYADRLGHTARRVTLGQTDAWGMAYIGAYLPAATAIGIHTLLTDLASTAPADDERSADQVLADTFTTCFTGPAALNPAIAHQLDYLPACVEDPRFQTVTVEARQQQDALGAWEALRLLGSTLGITFSPGIKTMINVHVPVSTYTDVIIEQALERYNHPPDRPPRCGAEPCPHHGVRGDPDHRDAAPPEPSAPRPGVGAELCPHGDRREALDLDSASTLGWLDQRVGGDPDGRGETQPEPSAPGAGAEPCPEFVYSDDLVELRAGSGLEERDVEHHCQVDPTMTAGICECGDTTPRFVTYIEGIGTIADTHLEHLMRDAACRRILTDPTTGAPLDIGKTIHDPTAAMRRRVKLRDGVCRFPGCTTPVTQPAHPTYSIDLDHTIEHQPDGTGGATSDANLQVLCEHHHRVKHQTPWTPIQHPDGAITWRNNLLDQTITTHPDTDRREH